MDIPWIEKYRPKKLNEIISQDENIAILQHSVKTKILPHMIFYGPQGTGKTSTILSLVNELYEAQDIRNNVLELNASDERGINVVRYKIITFAKTMPSNNMPYKIIILDEADAMTKEAQASLRKVLEETCSITRFCFVCNYINQIIDPINSRCVKIKFQPIKKDDIVNKLKFIVGKEKLNVEDTALDTLAIITNGDLRKCILYLQNIKYCTDTKINTKDIYDMCKYLAYEEFLGLIKDVKNMKDIIELTTIIHSNGFIIPSILNNIIKYILENPRKDDKMILYKLSDIDRYINNNGDEYIQLLKLFTMLFLH